MGAPGYAPVCTLQGEIGCSGVDCRDIKGKLGFVSFLAGSDNRIVRGIWDRIRDAEGGVAGGGRLVYALGW